jgi:hypothetical protein
VHLSSDTRGINKSPDATRDLDLLIDWVASGAGHRVHDGTVGSGCLVQK